MMENPRILIVDDEETVRYFLSEELAHAGYAVLTAANGKEALIQLQQQPADLVLLDLKMHGMDGLQVMEEIEKQPMPPAVIILTAHASLDSAVDAMRLGGCDYLQKPCRIQDLLASVEKGLARRRDALRRHRMARLIEETARQLQSASLPGMDPAPSLQVLQARGLLLDRDNETVTCQGVSLTLTPTEFQILRLLMERPDQLISYPEMAAAIYGSDGGEWQSWEARQTLATHMWRLRRKIGNGPDGSPYIVNVRGRGYKFARDV
jgi:DNA-binding response OmpR family regulator